MRDSNWTLRMHRSSREAFGHQCRFDDGHNPDKLVGAVCIIALAFVLGIMVGGA